jgi:hypothetical protein
VAPKMHVFLVERLGVYNYVRIQWCVQLSSPCLEQIFLWKTSQLHFMITEGNCAIIAVELIAYLRRTTEVCRGNLSFSFSSLASHDMTGI